MSAILGLVCHSFPWSLYYQVGLLVVVALIGCLEYVEILSCFGASGSVIKPPSRSPQKVHIVKQRKTSL